MIRAPFPLQWPEGWPRTPADQRTASRFIVGMSHALDSLYEELDQLGAANVVLTSNMPTRANGRPYGSAEDPGVSVWFVLKGHERVFACDRWLTGVANIRAIALTLQAMRGIDRWGANDVVSRVFEGFKALPPPAVSKKTWQQIFGIQWYTKDPGRAADGTINLPLPIRQQFMAQVRSRYREMMKISHPDIGGAADRAADLGEALLAAEGELKVP